MSLYQELKRRNVFRVAIAYLAGAWLMTEVAGTLFPAFGVPDWGIRFVVILFVLGFLPALIISWAYEMTPEGLVREKDVVRDESITHLTAKRLDSITIALILVALVFIVTDRFFLTSRVAEQPATPAAVATDDVMTSAHELAVSSSQPSSIAVLPFTNRSANTDDAYFVDGIHDDLLTHISKIGSIKTISRTSVMQYRDTEKTIPEIAGELGVSTILEGGVQRAGTQIRINVQLIDARSDENLWAEIYDRQLSAENIFAIQSEISRAISEALQAVLSPAEQQRIEAIPTKSLEAYEAYLLGKQRMEHRNTESLEEAIEHLSKAVKSDPQFALAWSALGNANLVRRESAISEKELLLNAQAAIEKALELDPELGEAYTSLGMLRYNFDDEKGAESAFLKAIELAPNYSLSYHWFSIILSRQGRSEEAFEMISRAAELDPISPVIKTNLAFSLKLQGRYQHALIELEKAIAIDPTFSGAYDAMATINYQAFNKLARAARTYVTAIQLDPARSSYYANLGQLYLELGESNRAGLLFARSQELDPDGLGAHWGTLLLRVFEGDTDEIADNQVMIQKYLGIGPWKTQFSLAQLRNRLIADKQYSQALAVYSATYPKLVNESDFAIGLQNYQAAIDLALVLQKVGELEKANDLLDKCQDFIREQTRLGLWGGQGIPEVLILALHGEKTEAMSALRDAVDEGWRSFWWYYLRHDPNLASIRSETGFQLIVSEIEADMSAQMQQIRVMETRGEIAAVPGVVFNPK